ncbi:thymidylate synthase [Coriobacterium glomerans PW2]|uniref:Thymidylate synthase n=1 Tax=Coriobacterium glomerans (strain ATCC 49209 / DSM 20642 / JCM 10262 / PW2) TaxID=700015 RepID=F2N7N8_CORGP|nr:thymidylate synthase [Coriobacterium glomerans]AEB06930.1 thymidylate synthase [Coriobacterium glomerans PW2]
MSRADGIFVRMCEDILENGTSTQGERVRPRWADGASAYTLKSFGVTARYDLREEFPALTLRRTALKSAMDEVLWIYQRKSNNVHDLNSHIWDRWADESGSIGKAYGYQIAQLSRYPEGEFDQMDRVLYDLSHTPYSRRIMTSTYTFADLSDMHLYPCAYSCTYNVTRCPGDDALTLNMVLMQRSQDVLAANNWNVCQYALLLMMVAQVSGMIPGELLHVIADAHIYDRHVEIVRELIGRPRHPAPKVALNPDVTDFYAFTTDDLLVCDYVHGPQIKDIPIAV